MDISTIASAIARFENVNPKYNNPGAIMDVDYYAQTHKFRLMQYSTLQDGWDALNGLVTSYVDRGFTLSGMISKYAPAKTSGGEASNDPVNYSNTIAGWLGVDPGVKLSDLVNSSGGVDIGVPSYSSYSTPQSPMGDIVDTIDTVDSSLGLDTSNSGITNSAIMAIAVGVTGLVAYLTLRG